MSSEDAGAPPIGRKNVSIVTSRCGYTNACWCLLQPFTWGLGTVVIKDAVDTFSPVACGPAILHSRRRASASYAGKASAKTLTETPCGGGARSLACSSPHSSCSTPRALPTLRQQKAHFSPGTYCAFVPFLTWAISRIRPTIYNIVAMALCVVGVRVRLVCRRLRGRSRSASEKPSRCFLHCSWACILHSWQSFP